MTDDRPGLVKAKPRTVLSICESPAEKSFALALILEGGFKPPKASSDLLLGVGPVGLFFAQFAISTGTWSYRLDFALIHPGHGLWLAIEIDGHDFHDRTKEQARTDRQRDRRLTGHGWNVLRFTGSEVHSGATRCAKETLAIAARLSTARETG